MSDSLTGESTEFHIEVLPDKAFTLEEFRESQALAFPPRRRIGLASVNMDAFPNCQADAIAVVEPADEWRFYRAAEGQVEIGRFDPVPR